MNDIFYHITSASLSWNPFIYFLHTIHIIPPPEIVTGWHILCLIYFSCTIQVLIKQEQRSPHSWCHYTNFQNGAAPFSSAWPSGFIIGQSASNPTPESSAGLLTPLCWKPSPPPTHIPLTTLHPYYLYPPRVLTNGTLLYFIFKIALLHCDLGTENWSMFWRGMSVQTGVFIHRWN